MDRALSPQSQPPLQSRRPNNDSFRPALRFPTDPHRPFVLPSKLHEITSPTAGPSSASHLLQSRRKPWEVDVTRLDDFIHRSSVPKVVCIVGDSTPSSLRPILSSSYLRGSLVIVVTSAESLISSISPPNCVPAVRLLRLRRGPASSPQQQVPNGNDDHPMTASRLNGILDWAERVADGWRLDPKSQPNFAILHEDEGEPQESKWSTWKKKRPAPSPSPEDADGSFSQWTKRFALNSRSTSSSLASGSSGSVNVAEVPGRPSASRLSDDRMIRGIASSSNTSPSRDQSCSGQQAPAHSYRTNSITVKPPGRRLSILSLKSQPWTAPSSPVSPSVAKEPFKVPSFDVIINFLPSAASGSSSLVATPQAIANHAKALLRQTILVTTATQRFLVPIQTDTGANEGGRFGSMQRGRPIMAPVNTSEPGTPKERWSRPLSFIFGRKEKVSAKATSKRTALPTPPNSRPSSAEEQRTPFASTSSSLLPGSGGRTMPKLVHVLPFSSAVNGAAAGNARLIRNLEAFLLSWSFGGARGMIQAAAEEPVEGKRTIRPYLLDMSSLADVLKCSLSTGDREWSLADLVISGALDDEYSYTGAPTTVAATPPDVTITRPSIDIQPGTTPSRRRSRWGPDGLTLADLANEEMDEAWALRRAWLGGVADLTIYPNVEGRTTKKSLNISQPSTSFPTPSTSLAAASASRPGPPQAHTRSRSAPGREEVPAKTSVRTSSETARSFPNPSKSDKCERQRPSAFSQAVERDAKLKQESKSDQGHQAGHASSPPQGQRSQPEVGRSRSVSSKALPEPPAPRQPPSASWYSPVPPRPQRVTPPPRKVVQSAITSATSKPDLSTSSKTARPLRSSHALPSSPTAADDSMIDDFYSTPPPPSLLRSAEERASPSGAKIKTASQDDTNVRSHPSGSITVKTVPEPELSTSPPKRPARPARLPPPSSILAQGTRPRSGSSSPLRDAAGAASSERRRPGTGGSDRDKGLPITPPDSASSSEISSDVHETAGGTDKKKRWSSPTTAPYNL